MSALVTEHYVLQAAASATVSEAAARASLYVYSLSSSLVAMAFASRTTEVFRPFASAVLPAILGIFTVARLVDTGIEYQQALRGIARIRGYYRRLPRLDEAQMNRRRGQPLLPFAAISVAVRHRPDAWHQQHLSRPVVAEQALRSAHQA
jgi:hypothetical protein